MQVATEKDYAAAARQASSEQAGRPGGHEWHARIREIINEKGMITHSQINDYQGDEFTVITGR